MVDSSQDYSKQNPVLTKGLRGEKGSGVFFCDNDDTVTRRLPTLLIRPWLKTQTGVVKTRYRQLGGQIAVVIKEGEGHYPLAPKDRQPVVDFIVRSVR
jgi:hypothetical protein